jgi:tRNA pseudouridine55 synthase
VALESKQDSKPVREPKEESKQDSKPVGEPKEEPKTDAGNRSDDEKSWNGIED